MPSCPSDASQANSLRQAAKNRPAEVVEILQSNYAYGGNMSSQGMEEASPPCAL